MIRPSAVVVAMLLALAVGVRSQSNPLLGSWELNVFKSRFQHDSEPERETRTYTPCEGGGVGTRVVTEYGYSRVAVTTFCTRLDGKEYPYHSHIADRITETGTDWSSFQATIRKKGKIVRTTHSVVSQDGKTLTRTTKYPGEGGTDVQVYDKLPAILPVLNLGEKSGRNAGRDRGARRARFRTRSSSRPWLKSIPNRSFARTDQHA